MEANKGSSIRPGIVIAGRTLNFFNLISAISTDRRSHLGAMAVMKIMIEVPETGHERN